MIRAISYNMGGKEEHPLEHVPRAGKTPVAIFRCLTALSYLPSTSAQNNSATICSIESETDSLNRFGVSTWISRGSCVRAQPECTLVLDQIIDRLVGSRGGEYSGASSVLALLPTIGALLGAPTYEIWRLLTIVPLGGVISMGLSFGSAIMPIRVEDYEPAPNREVSTSSSFRLERRKGMSKEDQVRGTEELVTKLLDKLDRKLSQDKSIKARKLHIGLGLGCMFVLLMGAHTAMAIIEVGAVLSWWCWNPVWMHMWYFMVTAVAIAENWAQLPFEQQTKLYISDVPYNIKVTGGEDVTAELKAAGTLGSGAMTRDEEMAQNIGQVLSQLGTVKAGTVRITDSVIHTSPRNAILVMVSVIRESIGWKRSVLRIFIKCCSLGVFVMGTALFASAQLLSMLMAVMGLTILLAAVVFSRAIATLIIAAVDLYEPMVHVMVNSESEANQVIAKIMMLTSRDDSDRRQTRDIQVEIDGHVFANCRRVATRSKWYMTVLGIMGSPYDLAKVDRQSAARSQYRLRAMRSSPSTLQGSEHEYEQIELFA
ncbi:hypothetical protein B0I35DRAFT_437225 [Stachybotrys elegans]|uniref:Uncharacterized protein n=1 Tax=Stachybotrys elegans TaxID=80388 RepID=A0A8K0WP76_9HYPO|nr:hypothetical protein B0I35DRAFT_437225 [Stachybotrys elegans]